MIVLTVLCSETVTAAEDLLKRSLDQWWRIFTTCHCSRRFYWHQPYS